MIVSNADRFVTLRRNSAYVLDPVAASAGPTLSRQPVREGCLRVTVAGGTTGSGTVTVTGTVGGVAGVSEVLAFTGNGSKQTVKRFTAVSALATTGFADEATVATLSVQCVGPDGEPQRQDYDVATGVPARPRSSSGRWPGGAPGTERVQSARILLEDWEVWTPRVGDKVVDEATGDEYLVEEWTREFEGLAPFHSLKVNRL